MATCAHVLPVGLTSSLFRPKSGSGGSRAVALAEPEVASAAFQTCSQMLGTSVAETSLPGWLPPTKQALNDLLQLQENWDGYGAAQIEEQVAQNALMLLLEVMDNDAPVPSVVPLSDGGVQIEWHRRGRHLEIEFSADLVPGFYYYQDDGEEESEGLIHQNYDRVGMLVANLT